MKSRAYTFRILVIGAMLLAAVPATASEQDADTTLSPYFAIDSGDPTLDQLPLKKTDVEVAISGVIAQVVVTQSYANNGSRPINARYVFPASTRASVHGMKMTIGEHVITAKIREREQAREEFNEAREAGKSASLLEQQRPNVFSMDVSNVMPGDTIDIELRYTELLAPAGGTYEFVYPTVVGPRYGGGADPAGDQWVQSPYLHEGQPPTPTFNITTRLSTGIPIQELTCPSHEVHTAWEGENSATISLDPGKASEGNRDFILKYRLAGRQIESGLLLYEGEDENFFLLMAQPPERVAVDAIPPREYIFIVDVSGSMNGFPLNVSKKLLQSLIGSLRETDTFNVILFANGSHVLSRSSLPANAANIQQAISVIEQERGSGGTELGQAVARALGLPRDENTSRSLILVTDGYISAEKEVFSTIKANLNNANVFAFGIGSSVNRYLIEGVARAGKGEPFIVTDTSEAPAQAAKFQEYIASPVLTGISVRFDGFTAYDVEPVSIPDLFAERPILVFGKWRGNAEGTVTVEGAGGSGKYTQALGVTEARRAPEHRPLRYLWARTKVAELSDYGSNAPESEAAREITSLGLTYELLTEYTSFIAVHDVIRNTGEAGRDVAQPSPLPQGVSDLAVGEPGQQASAPEVSNVSFGQTARNVPEPEFFLLLLILAVGAGLLRLAGRANTRPAPRQ